MRDRRKKRTKFALHSCLFCSLPYSLVCVAKKREVLKCRPPKCTYDNGHWYQCVGLCELFRMHGGIIKCSCSFGNMWILVFSLLPCVCVCVTMSKLFNVTLLFVLKFALQPCLFCSLRTLLFALQFALQPCLCLEKLTTGFSKFVYEYGNQFHCVALYELF